MTIDISRGGATAVDTESLRRAAAILDEGAERLGLAGRAFARARDTAGVLAPFSLERGEADAAACRERAAGLASDLRHTADVYEFVELSMLAVLLGAVPSATGLWGGAGEPSDLLLGGERAGGPADPFADERQEIAARWGELSEASPEAAAEAEAVWTQWRQSAGKEGLSEFTGGAAALAGLLGFPVLAAHGALGADMLQRNVAALGRGTVPNGARLRGGGDAVTVTAVTTSRTTPPAGLAAAVRRIPDGGGDARVRVETYRMPGGARQHVVYIAGTRSPGHGGREAWDMKSNLELYRGRRSAAYNGVVQALDRAGVRPGEAVHGLGYSQGGMIGGRLALEGDYDVRSLLTVGSPIDVQGGGDLLQVAVRHTDDLIPALADGGMAAGGGSPDGIVVERTHDPARTPYDVAVPAHRLDAYAETAAHLDASGDPRARSVRALFDDLARAESVTVAEYEVVREQGQ